MKSGVDAIESDTSNPFIAYPRTGPDPISVRYIIVYQVHWPGPGILRYTGRKPGRLEPATEGFLRDHSLVSVMQTDDDVAMDPQACPTAETLDEIGTQWRLHVLHELQNGEHRFNELKEATGASSRTLSQTLDALMEAGLVDRRSEEAAPIAVYYTLTEKGEDLGGVFDELDSWAQKWVDPSEYEE